MEEEKHKCKICWKSFVNGRALGGHMRSHMLTHPFPSQLDNQTQHESASSSMADDRESETESSKHKPTRKRSRLNRRSNSIYVSLRHQEVVSESCTEQEPMSSIVSDGATAEDEDVAFSLMMLSRDTWQKEKEEESDERLEKKKKWFKCETCDKVFKTYQALGGHRASHKKKKALEDSSVIVVEIKKKKSSSNNGHECPICLKVFASGQALGGHKRSHATATVTTAGSENIPAKISMIDLNLPAPSEEEDLVSSVFNA